MALSLGDFAHGERQRKPLINDAKNCLLWVDFLSEIMLYIDRAKRQSQSVDFGRVNILITRVEL